MTVSELIKNLQNYPADMPVLTLGYEGGLNDVYIKSDTVVFNVNSKDTWYYGPHEYAGYDNNDDPNPGTKCVIIGRDK
jgi:hypothetical protein